MDGKYINLYKPNVFADSWEQYDDVILYLIHGLNTILDCENNFICLVKKENAKLMVELLDKFAIF